MITPTLKHNNTRIILFFILSQISYPLSAQKSVNELIQTARERIENLSPLKAHTEISKGGVMLIDLRESEELKSGKLAGAIHAPRGMLEFYADPKHPYYKPAFDKTKRIILYCASGGRSALAIKTLQEMGYTNLAHIDGGINAWKSSGLTIIE